MKTKYKPTGDFGLLLSEKSFKSGDRLTFGKHAGLTIDRVSQLDPGYIEWMREAGIIDSATLERYHRGEFRNDDLPPGEAKVWTF